MIKFYSFSRPLKEINFLVREKSERKNREARYKANASLNFLSDQWPDVAVVWSHYDFTGKSQNQEWFL